MMSNPINIRIYIALLLAVSPSMGQEMGAKNSLVSVSVSDKGLMFVSADLILPTPRSEGGDLVLFALPVQVLTSSQVSAPTDVHISRLASGSDYTLFVLACPRTVRNVHLAIQDGLPISETLDGKGKIEFDLSYSLMSQFEKALITSPAAISNLTYKITLPKNYDEADISVSNGIIVKTGGRSFQVALEDAHRNGLSRIWISFPNPSQRALDYAKLAFSVLLGLFALAFQIQPLRQRRLRWFVFVLIISSLIVLVAGYFSFQLAKRLDFLVFSAAALPTALYALCACPYLFFAKKLQAIIGGQVNVNGEPGQFASVWLIEYDKQGRAKTVAKNESTLEDGRYVFHVWPMAKIRAYRVAAEYGGVNRQSDEFQITKGEAKQIIALDLNAELQPATPKH